MIEVKSADQNRQIELERESLLEVISAALETPMIVLGFIWLILTIVEFTAELSPFLSQVITFIWIIFILDFLLKLTLAPRKGIFLKRNWLTLLALAVPALRIFRIARAARALRVIRASRNLRLIKIVSSFNRGMHALSKSLGRRGFGYVAALTFIVTLLGAAGIYAFEHETSAYIKDFGAALWWTAMVLTTMGSDYFPTTPEGRLLCLLLAIYGFAVFGYVTATVASFFVEREAANAESDVASAEMIRELRAEIGEIKAKLDLLNGRVNEH